MGTALKVRAQKESSLAMRNSILEQGQEVRCRDRYQLLSGDVEGTFLATSSRGEIEVLVAERGHSVVAGQTIASAPALSAVFGQPSGEVTWTVRKINNSTEYQRENFEQANRRDRETSQSSSSRQ